MSTSDGQNGTIELRDREVVTIHLTGEQATKLEMLLILMGEQMSVNLVNDVRDVKIAIEEQLHAQAA